MAKGLYNFNAEAYLAARPDVAADSYFAANPYEHYKAYGKEEGMDKVENLFDETKPSGPPEMKYVQGGGVDDAPTPILQYLDPSEGDVGQYRQTEDGQYEWIPSKQDFQGLSFVGGDANSATYQNEDGLKVNYVAEYDSFDRVYDPKELATLKETDPDQYYGQIANQIKDEYFSLWSMNEGVRAGTAMKELEKLKDVNPNAYYSARMDIFGREMGWQIGQNRADRNPETAQQLQEMLPDALAAGLTTDQVSKIVGTAMNEANYQNQVRIASLAESGGGGFNFGKDVLPGIILVGSFVTGAYGLDTLLTAGAAASTASAAGTASTASTAGAGAATYTAATPGFIGPSASLVGGANVAAADWAATSYALTQAASSFGMGALKGAGMSVLQDLITGRDINFGKAGIGALTGGVGSAAGNLASYYAAPYGEFASRAAGALSGGIAGGLTQAGLTGKDLGTGIAYGALAGLTSLKTVGIESTGARILADATIGGAKSTLRGGDFTEGAIASGTGSAVSAGVNTAAQAGTDFYKSVTAPTYEYGIKAPTTQLDINTDLSAPPVSSGGFSVTAPSSDYSFGKVTGAQSDTFYTPVYDLSKDIGTKIVKSIGDLAKTTAKNTLTKSIVSTISPQVGVPETKTATVQRQRAPSTPYSPTSSLYNILNLPDSTAATENRIAPVLTGSSYELRKYGNEFGNSKLVSFKDGKPQEPIPSGYRELEVVGAAKGGLIKKPSKKAKGVVKSKNALAAAKEDKLPTTRKGLAVK